MSFQHILGRQQPGFIFGGNTGVSYEDLQRQRQAANQIRQNLSRTPQTFAGGLSALGQGFLLASMNRKIAAQEKAGREEFESAFQTILGGATAPQTTRAGKTPYSGFNTSLARSESGGDYGITNSEGYGGKYQFGQDRLDDFNRANGTQFRVSALTAGTPEAGALTEKVQNWHVGDIDNFINQNGLDKYVGQNIGGVTMTQDGLRAMAHLGGVRGMQRFLTSGGRYNPSDSNGTSLLDYAGTHAGSGGVGGTELDPNLVQLLDNPYASPGQKAVMQLMLQRQMAASAPPDPMQALQRQQAELAVQRSQVELDQMRNPDRAIIQGADGFKYYQDTGERVLPGVSQGANQIVTGDAAEAYGLNPALSYNITDGPEGVRATQIGGGGTNVTVNNIPETGQRMGTIPQGYSAVPDPSNPSGYRMEAIPGGPEDTEEQDALAAEVKELSADIVLDEIGISRALINGQSWDSPATGMTGRAASLIDSTRAGSLKHRLETIKANIGFDKLQAMRDASPTGGALGPVSDFENRLLQAVMGSLEQAQRSEDLLYNLDRLDNIYGRIIHQGIPEQEARQIYRDIALGSQPGPSTDAQTGTDAPTGVAQQPSVDQLSDDELLKRLTGG